MTPILWVTVIVVALVLMLLAGVIGWKIGQRQERTRSDLARYAARRKHAEPRRQPLRDRLVPSNDDRSAS